MIFKSILASAAAVGVAVTPIAATAGTTAGSSLPAAEAGAIELGDRASTSVKKKENLAGGSSVIIAVLAAAAVIAGIIVAADGDDDEDLSPGT